MFTVSDGFLVLRRQRPDDIDMHLSAIDEEQIVWLWQPGDRARWDAMTPRQQRDHQLRHLQRMHDTFGPGPKWAFSVDAPGATYALYIDCDLANPHVPAGEANISFTCHPAYRGRGWVTRAVRLVCMFLRDQTSVRRAHLIVDSRNLASLRVAHAVGAREVERFTDEHSHTVIRHVIDLDDGALEPAPAQDCGARSSSSGLDPRGVPSSCEARMWA